MSTSMPWAASRDAAPVCSAGLWSVKVVAERAVDSTNPLKQERRRPERTLGCVILDNLCTMKVHGAQRARNVCTFGKRCAAELDADLQSLLAAERVHEERVTTALGLGARSSVAQGDGT